MTLLLFVAALFAVDAKAPEGDAPAKLRVATFNIRYDTPKDGEDQWSKRTGLVYRTIERMDPDLLGIQESLPSQFDDLKAALPAYEFFGAGRVDGKREGEFVPVAFKAKRFEKLAAGHFWLSDTPEKVGSRGWDAALPRMVTWVRLKDRGDGRLILFVNTHFDHKGAKARAESSKLLRAWLEKNRDGVPVVITGDFNATEDQPPYATLVDKSAPAAARLTDSYRAAHPERGEGETTFHGFKGGRSGNRIDWILHSPDFKAVSCDVVHDADGTRYPSDHYPVVAELEFVAPDRP